MTMSRRTPSISTVKVTDALRLLMMPRSDMWSPALPGVVAKCDWRSAQRCAPLPRVGCESRAPGRSISQTGEREGGLPSRQKPALRSHSSHAVHVRDGERLADLREARLCVARNDELQVLALRRLLREELRRVVLHHVLRLPVGDDAPRPADTSVGQALPAPDLLASVQVLL